MFNPTNEQISALAGAFASSGAKSAFTKDSPIGTSVTGTISSWEMVQVTDFMSGTPQFWDNGDPKMQLKIIISTNLVEDEGDTGERSVWVKTWGVQRKAFQDAVEEAGGDFAKALAPGSTLSVTFTGMGQAKGNFPAPKLYAYKLTPAAATQAQAAFQTAPQTQQVQQVQAVAQQAPVAQPVAQAQAPTPQTQQAPTPQAQAPANPLQAQILALINNGATDAQISAQTGLPEASIATLRTQLASQG